MDLPKIVIFLKSGSWSLIGNLWATFQMTVWTTSRTNRHTGILADLMYSRCPGRMACNPSSETRSASTLRQETVEKTGAPQDLDQFGLKDVERVVKACLPRFFWRQRSFMIGTAWLFHEVTRDYNILYITKYYNYFVFWMFRIHFSKSSWFVHRVATDNPGASQGQGSGRTTRAEWEWQPQGGDTCG